MVQVGKAAPGEHVHPALHDRCALERERQDGRYVRAPARARAPRPRMRGLQMRPRLHRPALSPPRRGCALGQLRRLLHRRPDAARPARTRRRGRGCRGARGGHGLLRRHGARRGRREQLPGCARHGNAGRFSGERARGVFIARCRNPRHRRVPALCERARRRAEQDERRCLRLRGACDREAHGRRGFG